MAGVYRYIAYDGSAFNVDLGNQAVRLGTLSGFTELAQLGAVGQSTLIIDDPLANVGHSSDGILGLQRLTYDENSATLSRVFAGWTGRRKYARGTDSLRIGAARKIEVSLLDGNTLAGRRILKPKVLDSSVNRPAESPAARIAWLLSSGYLPYVADHGLVSPAGSPTLEAHNLEGQHPADVLNEIATTTGDNWFIYWDQTAAGWGLACFNMTTYNGYLASLALSNDRSLVDSDVVSGSGANNCWAVQLDADLTTDPDSVVTEVLIPWAHGTEYRSASSSAYPAVARSAPSTNVRTAARADLIGDRFLDDNADETDRITCSAKIAAANVNDALVGQLVPASFTHLPPYTTASYFRIARRTVAQVEQTNAHYLVTFELVPASPVYPTSSFAKLDRGTTTEVESETLGTHLLTFVGTGDVPPSGGAYASEPKYGLMDYDGLTGIEMLGAGTLSALFCKVQAEFAYSAGKPSNTFQLVIKNGGSVIASSSVQTDPDPAVLAHAWAPTCVIDLDESDGIVVANGDILEAYVILGGHAADIGAIPIAGSGAAGQFWFLATGDLA